MTVEYSAHSFNNAYKYSEIVVNSAQNPEGKNRLEKGRKNKGKERNQEQKKIQLTLGVSKL